jgi:hypothetical protein
MSYLKHDGVIFVFISSEKSRNDGAQPFHQPDIHICFERIVLFPRNMFKFRGHTQYLEICATSKKIMLFYDNGFVLFRFASGCNESSMDGSCRNARVNWKVALCIP